MLGLLGQRVDLLPLLLQPGHVALDLLGADALGRGAHDDAVALGPHPVEDAPQALALVVGQPLGDAVGRAVGDEHHEPAGDRHLLGEAGALVGDRVLGDLADDVLLGLEHLLDAEVVALLLDVLGLVLHVAAVEHRVLRRGDVDEGGLHAGQHVLHPADVDVAVDLGHVVGRPGHVVLDEAAALEHGDLGGGGAHRHGHQVAADRTALALAAPLGTGVVEVDRVATDDGGHRLGRGPLGGAATAALATCRRRRPAPPLPRLPSPSALALAWPWPPRPTGAAAAPAPSTPAAATALGRGLGGLGLGAVGASSSSAAGAGRLSPIWGRRTSAFSAASADFGLPSKMRSGSSSGLRSRAVPRPRPRRPEPTWPSLGIGYSPAVAGPLRGVVPPSAAVARTGRSGRRRSDPRRFGLRPTRLAAVVGTPGPTPTTGAVCGRRASPRRRRLADGVGRRAVLGSWSVGAAGCGRAGEALAARGGRRGGGGLGFVGDRVGHGEVPFS